MLPTRPPTPAVIFGSRPLAANKRPSERTPVFTAASSTTSATIEPMMTKPISASVPATIPSPVSRITGITGEPLGGKRPSRRSVTGITPVKTERVKTVIMVRFLSSARDRNGATTTMITADQRALGTPKSPMIAEYLRASGPRNCSS